MTLAITVAVLAAGGAYLVLQRSLVPVSYTHLDVYKRQSRSGTSA